MSVVQVHSEAPDPFAGVAHLVERSLAKAEVAGSSPVSRSIHETAPRQPRRFMNGFVLRSPLHNQIGWRHSQVVRQRSAKSPPPVRIWVAPPEKKQHPHGCCFLLQFVFYAAISSPCRMSQTPSASKNKSPASVENAGGFGSFVRSPLRDHCVRFQK